MILTVLRGHRVEIAQRFAAKRLAIFGSADRVFESPRARFLVSR